jgi:hypothetical protein
VTEQQVSVALAVSLGLPLLAFLAKWVFGSTIAEIRGVAADVKEMVRTVQRHETDLALALLRIGRLEAEVGSLRERQHEHASQLQAAVFRAAKGTP